MSRRRPWTESEDASLRAMYPEYSADEIAPALGRTTGAVHQRAKTLGLRKPVGWIAARASERSRQPGHGGRRHLFRPGHQTWNKGKPFNPGGRSAETRFKPGRKPEESSNYRPIGSVRVSKGYLERKVTDDTSVYPAHRWQFVHRLVWEQAHGPIPAGYVVAFKPGCHTVEEAEITPDKLELISRKDLATRNSIHRYPPELTRVIKRLARARRALESRT